MVVFWQNGCIRANWLYLGKIGFIRANCWSSGKVVVIGQSGCNRAKWLSSGKVVVFGQKWLL